MNKIDLSTILASAIHESKNQVGTLLYQLQGLKDTLNDNESSQKKIVSIEESLKKLNDEWVEYLYLYRLASDGYELHMSSLLLDEFLDDQVFALLPSANAKNLKLSYDCDIELIGHFDERLMTAVVSTAVYNALRFAKSKILLTAKQCDDFLVITIEDDGEGFTVDSLDQEEEDFLASNTGLGLYFAGLSAQAHEINQVKGFIQKTASDLLGGAKLSVHLPQETGINRL